MGKDRDDVGDRDAKIADLERLMGFSHDGKSTGQAVVAKRATVKPDRTEKSTDASRSGPHKPTPSGKTRDA